jgi:hypothetical protein
METSLCFECGAKIGGLSHRLDSQHCFVDGIFEEALSRAHR